MNLPGTNYLTAVRRKVEQWNRTISLMPIAMLLVIYGVSMIFPSIQQLYNYDLRNIEDGIFEWMQFLCYATASIAGFCLFLRIHRNEDRRTAYGWLLFAVVCLFITGEEISWGERIFSIHLEWVRSVNSQNETNIHNLQMIQPLLHRLYVITCVFLTFGRRMFPKISVLPDKWLALFFFIPGLWYLIFDIQYYLCTHCIPNHQEIYELLIALGLAIHAANNLGFNGTIEAETS